MVRASRSHREGHRFKSCQLHQYMNRKQFIQYRDLFWQLTLREIKAKYKQSVLGYSWVILVPLINLGVLSIVFSFLLRVPTGNIPYPIFLFVALVPWIFMSNAISAATSSVIINSSLITKISLPREVFPFSAIASKLVDLLLTTTILTVFLIIYKINFQLTLFFLPLILLIQIILITGVSLILSATNVFFRDVEHAIGLMLMVWMYLTPIIYSPEMIPANLKIYFFLNPMTGLIDAYRRTILYGFSPDWSTFGYSTIFSLLLLGFASYYFKKRARFFADVI